MDHNSYFKAAVRHEWMDNERMRKIISRPAEQKEKSTARIEAFSDGVIAIAVTLLVLELVVPDVEALHATSHSLGRALGEQWPSYVAFLSSFCAIFIMWVHHNVVLHQVENKDAKLVFANGFLLLMITFVPFPTAVIAKYFMTPAGPLACLFYSATFVLVAIAFSVFVKAAFRPAMLSSKASPATIARIKKSYRSGPWIYGAAVVAALFSTWVSFGICVASWILWTLVTLEQQDREG
jgi:uncharacterized membrane protein